MVLKATGLNELTQGMRVHRDDERSEDHASSLEDGKGAGEGAAREGGGDPGGWCLPGQLKNVF